MNLIFFKNFNKFTKKKNFFIKEKFCFISLLFFFKMMNKPANEIIKKKNTSVNQKRVDKKIIYLY